MMRLLFLSLVFALGYFLLPPSLTQQESSRMKPEPAAPRQQQAPSVSTPRLQQTPEAVPSAEPVVVDAAKVPPVARESEVSVVEELAVETSEQEAARTSASSATISALTDHLIRSIQAMEKIPAYSATLEQQVQKRGRVLDADWIDIKIRRSPFSVYLKWHGDNQEVIYVEGLNDGRLLAHPTRGLASLRPVWKIRPDSQQAMKSSRYPLTEIGIEKLSKIALDFYQQNKNVQKEIVCISIPVLADGRPATAFEVRFANDSISPQYATSRLTFDHETEFLVSLESHSWGADGKPGELLEMYRYHRITPNSELNDVDFSELNPEYNFRR